jgi:hypothetical protein
MKHMKSKAQHRRIPTWNEVAKVLEVRGWQLYKDTKFKKVFVRGNERIVAFRTVGGKWKAEYFYKNKLEDTSGIFDANFVKLMTMEMGVLK